jgi:hypothetical protein
MVQIFLLNLPRIRSLQQGQSIVINMRLQYRNVGGKADSVRRPGCRFNYAEQGYGEWWARGLEEHEAQRVYVHGLVVAEAIRPAYRQTNQRSTYQAFALNDGQPRGWGNGVRPGHQPPLAVVVGNCTCIPSNADRRADSRPTRRREKVKSDEHVVSSHPLRTPRRTKSCVPHSRYFLVL